ncbi:conjugal transfer protein [Herbidospora yilanensis]|uniref:conjugal transfer protein n=1 Tax=Herbidospora yilanensis TaxID=354426 RepID=UPI001E2A8DB0|nr:conjugal transfer protein [Herbidospora yilanensis]
MSDREPLRRRGWSGGGGRWLVWTGRAVLWALIVVIVVNGVRAPFERFTSNQGAIGTPSAPADSGFPVQQGAAFANQFAAVYLNFDGTNPEQRDTRLTDFLADGVERRFGWNGFGRMAAGAIQFHSIEVADANNARVQVSFQSGARRWLLSVPIFQADGRFVVSGLPALLPSGGAAGLPAIAAPDRDANLEDQLRQTLEGFFRAYASGNAAELKLYAADGATIEGLGGQFTLAQLNSVVAPLGGETGRDVTVTVTWSITAADAAAVPTDDAADPAAQPALLEQAYQLTMEKQGDKWLVRQVQGASRSVG